MQKLPIAFAAALAALVGTGANAAHYIDVSFTINGAHVDMAFDAQNPADFGTGASGTFYADYEPGDAFSLPSVSVGGNDISGYDVVFGSLDLSSFDLTPASFDYHLGSGGGWFGSYTVYDDQYGFPAQSSGVLYNISIVGTDNVLTPHLTVTGRFASPSAVPEPASWALMLGGFGLVGGALRSRRKAAVRLA